MKNKIYTSIVIEDAELVRDNLADLLCWWEGFKTGLKISDEDFDNHCIAEYGIKAAREINIKIKDAINNHEK